MVGPTQEQGRTRSSEHRGPCKEVGRGSFNTWVQAACTREWRRENQTLFATAKGEEMAAERQAAAPRPAHSALTQQQQRASCRCGLPSLCFRTCSLPG